MRLVVFFGSNNVRKRLALSDISKLSINSKNENYRGVMIRDLQFDLVNWNALIAMSKYGEGKAMMVLSL